MAKETRVFKDGTAGITKTDPSAALMKVVDLVPWLENPRVNDAAVPKVAKSIETFGFGAPIIIRRANREIIAGHTRLAAAIRLGLEEVPVRVLDLTAEQAHALAIADNKLGELAEWDDEKLSVILGALPLNLIEVAGIPTEEADRILAGAGLAVAGEGGTAGAGSGDVPEGLPQDDPKEAVTEILAEVRIPPAISKSFLEELRALVARHPGVTIGIG